MEVTVVFEFRNILRDVMTAFYIRFDSTFSISLVILSPLSKIKCEGDPPPSGTKKHSVPIYRQMHRAKKNPFHVCLTKSVGPLSAAERKCRSMGKYIVGGDLNVITAYCALNHRT